MYAGLRNSIVCLWCRTNLEPMITSRNKVSPFKPMVVECYNLTRDNPITVNMCPCHAVKRLHGAYTNALPKKDPCQLTGKVSIAVRKMWVLKKCCQRSAQWLAKTVWNTSSHENLNIRKILLECPHQSGSLWPHIFRFRHIGKYETASYAFGIESIDTIKAFEQII